LEKLQVILSVINIVDVLSDDDEAEKSACSRRAAALVQQNFRYLMPVGSGFNEISVIAVHGNDVPVPGGQTERIV
jgi:hypothetical protein